MANQQELDRVYLLMAKSLSQLSKADRLQVGCLIVKDTHIIAEGVNGMPRGLSNVCEYYDCVEQLYTKKEVIHAEMNALFKLARSTQSSIGATAYCTNGPCFDCAKSMIQAGIVRLVYTDTYRKEDGIRLLKDAGIEIQRYGEEV